MINHYLDNNQFNKYFEFLMGGSNKHHLDTINDTGFITAKMKGGFKNNSRKRRLKKEGVF